MFYFYAYTLFIDYLSVAEESSFSMHIRLKNVSKISSLGVDIGNSFHQFRD